MMGSESLPPGWPLILGAFLLPLVPRRLQGWGVLFLATTSLVAMLIHWADHESTLLIFGLELVPVRIDWLSRPFALVFHLAAIVTSIFALHVRDLRQHMAASLYAGAGIAAACSGDLLTLFVFWEITAISSVFLVLASDNEPAYRSAMRYLLIQVGSGVFLLCGAILHWVQTDSLRFEALSEADLTLSPAAWLIVFAFGIKAAFPMLHSWLQDAYPQSTPTGTVFLSAFTTKLAVYALARGFSGWEPLIAIGCVMTLFPIVFAVIENDLRRVLAYSLNNQLGFMVVGIGIGTELAINGTIAHAFCHIIYKALLFMTMGAVLYRVGTTKATELGGLHKSMPWTTLFCLIGAGAISGFPLLSGFVSKSMIISAAAEEHQLWVWTILLIASAGVMEHSGIKIPFFAFFAHDSGKRVKEAPWNMLVAMGIASGGCILLGVAYPLLYRLLPYEVDYQPYTVTHVVTQLQLLLFAMLAFVVLWKTGLCPSERRATILDSDWIYRKCSPKLFNGLKISIATLDHAWRSDLLIVCSTVNQSLKRLFNEHGAVGRTWSTSTMAMWTAVLLAGCLLLVYG